MNPGHDLVAMLISVIISLFVLALALDGLARIVGVVNFPVTRWLGRTTRKLVGGGIAKIGSAIAGGSGKKKKK